MEWHAILAPRRFRFAKKHPGGAEIPLSLLFADIRGSTSLAEELGTARFSALISRFYNAVTDELIQADLALPELHVRFPRDWIGLVVMPQRPIE